MKKWLVLIISAALLTGCGAVSTLTEGFKQAQEVADDLKDSVGTKPFVGFNWTNGSLSMVTVNFTGFPPGKTNEEVAACSRSAIETRFRQRPQRIVISYTLSGDAPGLSSPPPNARR